MKPNALIAAVDALIMIGIAARATGLRLDAVLVEPVLWGAAIAAAVCAVVVVTSGSALLAWAAIGYVLYGGLLAPSAPSWAVLALAVALVPLVPRPRGSLAAGLAIAAAVALVTPVVVRGLP